MSLLDDSKPAVSIEVADYIVQGDVNFYNNHNFIIKVWMGQEMYSITRSYLSFCELDAKLRRQFARSKLPVLNLAGAGNNNKKINSKIVSNIKQKNVPDSRASILFADPDAKLDKKALVRRIDTNEIIAYKKTTLHTYLQDLMKIPEILQSDILLYFVDEESISGEMVPDVLDETQEKLEVSMLIGDEESSTKTVRKDMKVDFNLDAEDVLLWSFSTKLYDIGFSLQFNGIDVITYQRYQSQDKTILGSYEAVAKGKVTLNWDNSYSKMRSKILTYTTKVVGKVEYDNSVASAQELRREKLRMTKQRQGLKKILARLSMDILSHIGGSIGRNHLRAAEEINHQIYDEYGEVIVSTNNHSAAGSFDSHSLSRTADEDLHAVVNQLRNEKKFLQQALSESELALVSERTATAEIMQQAEDSQVARTNLEEEVHALRSELDHLRQEQAEREHSALATIKEQEDLVKELTLEEILALPVGGADSLNIYNYFEVVREYASKAMVTLGENSRQIEALEGQTAKLKAEKKQLKAYAIQQKAENEELTKSLEQKTHDNTLMSHENLQLKQKIERMEVELSNALASLSAAATSRNSSRFADNEEEDSPAAVVVVNNSSGNLVHLFKGDEEDEDITNTTSAMRRSESYTSNEYFDSNDRSHSGNAGESKLIKIDLASPPPDELHTYLASMKSSMYEMSGTMGSMWNAVVGQDTRPDSNNSNSSTEQYSDIYSTRRASVPPQKPKMNFGF